jgi:hypothetical protein
MEPQILKPLNRYFKQNREVTSIVKKAIAIRITILTAAETKRMKFWP